MNIEDPSISNPGLLRSELEKRVFRFGRRGPALLASLGFAALLSVSAPALAQVSPNLGTAAPYAVMGTNAVTCTTSTINGDVGTSAASITNTGCTITGAVDTPVAASVVADFNSAYAAIDGANPCTGTIPIVTATLPPGVYCSAAPASAGTTMGPIILTLNGNASDVWVFRVGDSGLGALVLTNTQVVMGGTAQACNVFWKTEEAATLTTSSFVGTVLAGTSITMTGGSWVGRALATIAVTTTNAAPLSFAGCAPPASITVSKDFIPNSAAPVSVALSCTSGTVITTPLVASEGAPAVFSVGGALAGATCTATETVPAGYTANQASCVGMPLGGSCTITNTLNAGAITVIKDFIPDSTATVPVSLTCTSGTVTTTPLNASEAAPAVFAVTGAAPGTTCTATETVPAGYTASQGGCVNVPLGGSCTITNALVGILGAERQVPTLSEWAMVLLASLMAIGAFASMRRRRPR